MAASTEETQSSVPQKSELVSTTLGTALAGKYLTFTLSEEEYGVEILKVIEIIGVTDITEVPQTSDFVKGVINLRGKVIPVIDLRLRFGLEQAEYNAETCVIVIDTGHSTMGVIVDSVSEVLDMSESQIEGAPSLGLSVDTSFIRGLGKTENRVCILLDIASVLEAGTLVNA